MKQKPKKRAGEGMQISNCHFHAGAKWDPPALETLNKVAEGLLNLTRLFTASGVQMEAMVKVGAFADGLSIGDSLFEGSPDGKRK